MKPSEPAHAFSWRTAFPTVLIAGGFVTLLLSLLWPNTATSRSSWSHEKAKQYQAASVKLHSLSHAAVHVSPETGPQASRQELQQAEADYNAIRAQLDSAIDSPKRLTLLIRGIGVVLVLTGGFGLFYMRPASD